MTDYKHKINAEGEYLPFYGYTSVSMLSSKTSSVLQKYRTTYFTNNYW